MMRKSIPFAPYVPHTVKVLPLFSKSERESMLKEAHYNLLNLNTNQITFDLYTDSGYASISTVQAANAYHPDHGPDGMGQSAKKLRAMLSDTLNYPYIILSAQGRSAELSFSQLMVAKDELIPCNMTFFTTQYHQKKMGGKPISIVCKEASELQSNQIFKGNVDIEALKDVLSDKDHKSAYVNIETCANAAGGYPISLRNLKEVFEVTRVFEVPLILDSTRILENAYFIKTFEEGYENKSILEIVREIGAHSDGCVLSLKKNFLANMGGAIGVQSRELYYRLRDHAMISGTEIPGPNMEFLSRGIQEAVRDEHIFHRVQLTKRLFESLKSYGIPVLEPHSGHGVWIDIDEFVPHIPAHANPPIALQNALYVEGGIRTGVGHFNPPNSKGHTFIRITLPHRLYSESHIDFFAQSVKVVWDHRHEIRGYELTSQEPGMVGSFEAKYEPVQPDPSVGKMVFKQIDRLGEKAAVWYFKDDQVTSLTYRELGNKVKQFGSGLVEFGLQKGDRVGFLTYNSVEAIIAYVSTASIGVVDVPMYYSYTPQQIKNVILDASARYMIVSSDDLLKKVLAIRDELPWPLKIVHLNPTASTRLTHDIKSFEQIIELGRGVPDEAFQARLNSVSPTDLMTIMYSSGTTGEPKGIMLNHRVIALNSSLQRFTYDMNDDDIFMLIFKISHATGRYWMFYTFKQGAAVGIFNCDLLVLDKLDRMRPTILPATPDFFEEVYQSLSSMLTSDEIALIQRVICEEGQSEVDALRGFRQQILEIREKVKKGLGGRVRYGLIGGAQVPPKHLAFYNAFGFPLLQTFGTTETNIICSETFKHRKFGTVGKVRPGTLYRQAEDGELLVHSPYQMDGYYNKPQLTRDALVEMDGFTYFRTGDIVDIDKDGFVKILGRSKDYFSLSSAFNIQPQFLEKLLCESPLVVEAFVVGDGKDHVGALLVPDVHLIREKLRDCGLSKVSGLSDEELVEHIEVRRLYCDAIHDVNEKVAEPERILKFALLKQPFLESRGEISENGKKLRRVIQEHYRDLIESLYKPVPVGIG